MIGRYHNSVCFRRCKPRQVLFEVGAARRAGPGESTENSTNSNRPLLFLLDAPVLYLNQVECHGSAPHGANEEVNVLIHNIVKRAKALFEKTPRPTEKNPFLRECELKDDTAVDDKSGCSLKHGKTKISGSYPIARVAATHVVEGQLFFGATSEGAVAFSANLLVCGKVCRGTREKRRPSNLFRIFGECCIWVHSVMMAKCFQTHLIPIGIHFLKTTWP